MRWRRCLTFGLVAICGLTACNRGSYGRSPSAGSANGASNGAGVASTQPMATNTTATSPLTYLDRPLPKLPTVKLWLGKQEIAAEIAAAPHELATGMMHRKEIGESEGMLFIMPVPQRASFYMRNTVVPLSVAYIDTEGTILEIYDLQPLNEQPVPSKADEINFVLEMKQGWFDRNQVGIGTVIRTEHGSLRETFSRRRR
jgi:uncharacterized protein